MSIYIKDLENKVLEDNVSENKSSLKMFLEKKKSENNFSDFKVLVKKNLLMKIIIIFIFNITFTNFLIFDFSNNIFKYSNNAQIFAKPKIESNILNSEEDEYDPDAGKTNDNTISDLLIQSGDRPGQLLLTWKVKPQNRSPIVIKRFSRPMSTLRIFNKGTIITKRKLRANTTYFIDKNVPEGVHYYAVVTEEELNSPEILNLTTGNNYTQNPFIVTKPKDPILNIRQEPKTPDTEILVKKYPSNLNAINTNNSVILSWTPGQIGNSEITYLIYRSNSPLDSKEAYKNNEIIGKSTNTRLQFIDKKPIYNNTVYYGVIIEGELENEDLTSADLNLSFIEHKFEKKYETEFLKGRFLSNAIILNWSALNLEANEKYYIYKSDTEPLNINSLTKIDENGKSNLISIVNSNKTTYTDNNPVLNKVIYYAVLVARNDGSIITQDLNLGKNLIRLRFKRKIIIKEIKAINTDTSVILSWTPVDIKSNEIYKIFRSRKIYQNQEDLKSSELIGTCNRSQNRFVDVAPIANEDVYYAVVISSKEKKIDIEEEVLFNGWSFVKHRFYKDQEITEIIATNTNNSVIITWSPVHLANEKYKIFRSLESLDTKEVVFKAKVIGVIDGGVPQFEDLHPLPNQEVYYGVAVSNFLYSPNFDGLRNKKSFILHKFKKQKIKIIKTPTPLPKEPISTKPNIENLLHDLDIILSQTYFKNKNSECIDRVYGFINETPEYIEVVQAKATFFLGLCHFKIKSYKKAMRLFSAPSVKKIYPERAKFWFERSIEANEK